MDFLTLFSFFLYVITFLAGFILDKHPEKESKARNIYIFWLYIFLCFGYMVGSDWNTYELDYTQGYGIGRYLTEPISYFIFTSFPKIILDFWVFCGIAKCIYLYSLIKLLKTMTDRWLSSLSMMMPFMLLFMLISNPLRYMLALCFINCALLLIVRKVNDPSSIKHLWLKVMGLVVIAACVQNTCAVFLVLLPLILLYKKIGRANRVVIFVVFIITIVATSNLSIFASIKDRLNAYLSLMMGIRDYASYYEYEDNSALFSLGNLFKVFFLFAVLAYRDIIIKNNRNGLLLYGVSILALFLERFFLLVPTAFRWAIPFDYFYIVYFISCLSYHLTYARIIALYATFLLCKSLWFTPTFIPYTNSIPYILTGHLPYSERIQYNRNAYFKRTGERLDDWEDYSY